MRDEGVKKYKEMTGSKNGGGEPWVDFLCQFFLVPFVYIFILSCSPLSYILDIALLFPLVLFLRVPITKKTAIHSTFRL